MQDSYTVITHNGQITLPEEIIRALDLKEGDRISLTVNNPAAHQVTLKPAQSIVRSLFGSVTPSQRPEDLRALRQQAIEDIAENAMSEGRPKVEEK